MEKRNAIKHLKKVRDKLLPTSSFSTILECNNDAIKIAWDIYGPNNEHYTDKIPV